MGSGCGSSSANLSIDSFSGHRTLHLLLGNVADCSHASRPPLSLVRATGKFYRAEKQLLLQGIVSETSAAPRTQVALGPCPVEDYVPKSKCPAHDPHCGCHGPVMTKGMVGWAGGGAGPDFFINTFVSARAV